MKRIVPPKLKTGDVVRVIAPASSLSIIDQDVCELANQRLEEMGLKVTVGPHAREVDDFSSSSVESRIADLHEAFEDQNVKAILTAIGGYNSNQLLQFIA